MIDFMAMSSADTAKLAKSMLAVQRDMVPATKDATNPYCKNRYATLNSVMDACRPALDKHGIWLTQLPMPAPVELGPGHIGLMTKMTHVESGQWQASFTVAPLPKDDPQGMGSALTYMRRYALTAMLGMIMEDDDGNASTVRRQSYQQSYRREAEPQQHDEPPAWHDEEPDSYQETPSAPPGLPGVRYEMETDANGRQIYVARGKTLPVKDQLKAS